MLPSPSTLALAQSDSAQRERKALDWLFRFADMERGVGWNPASTPEERWYLGRTRVLLDELGAPDRGMRCILVAGTNGKGSTAAMLASLLDAAGIHAGLYSQPHLQVYRERIRVDGAIMEPDCFGDAVARLLPAVQRLAARHPEAGEPTTFELTTAMALDVFARARCEVAVLEVGLGGRLDATNAVEPALSVVASIGYDHTAILGSTLSAIATEKAGVFRAKRPALVAAQRPSADQALLAAARRVGACIRVVPPLSPATGTSPGRERVRVATDAGGVDVTLPIPGAAQRQNAALAVAAAQAILSPARTLTPDVVECGLERVRWPGRLELVERNRAAPVLLDGAHNGPAAASLADALRTHFSDRPLHLVVGMYADKDSRSILRPLLPLATSVWATAVADHPRALTPAAVANTCRRLGRMDVRIAADLEAALTDASIAAGSNGLVCVTGSLALVGEARGLLGVAPAERLWQPQARLAPGLPG